MATRRPPYQLARIENGTDSDSASTIRDATSDSADTHRQYDSSSVSEESGETRSRSLTKLASRILLLAHQNGITILPQHIRGQLNVLADLASRVGQVVPSEWAVDNELFAWIRDQSPLGPYQIDLFANRWNHRLEKYVSPCPDEEAWAVDALTCQWPDQPIYAFF